MAVTLLVVGAGQRYAFIDHFCAPPTQASLNARASGTIYATYAKERPERAKVVAVAETNEHRRTTFARQYDLSSSRVFSTWQDVTALPERIADAVLICTPDREHADAAIAFAGKGYHILLEKPMAITLRECAAIERAVHDATVTFAVGHVLRYTARFRAIKEVIDSGAIGEVQCVQHLEPVGFFHFAHSYVRGNWRNEREATFSLMAKSCHDIDIITHMLGGARCRSVSSFGSLRHFRKENKPAAAAGASRCMDCPITATCPYSAKRIYLDPVADGKPAFGLHAVVDVPDIENVADALRNGPYGRCVYESDNDVVDNQVVNMEFEGGQTASFTMIAFSEAICVRKTHVFGSHGEIISETDDSVTVFDFSTQTRRNVPLPHADTTLSGHGGGDFGLMHAFVSAVEHKDQALLLSGPAETLQSHSLVFAAEHARRTRSVVDVQQFLQQGGA